MAPERTGRVMISIVVPTLNERARITGLLKSSQKQQVN